MYIAIAKYSYCVRLNGFCCCCCCYCWLVKAQKAAFNRFVSKQNRTEELFGYIMSWQQTLPLQHMPGCMCVCVCVYIRVCRLSSFVYSWGWKYLLRESFILNTAGFVLLWQINFRKRLSLVYCGFTNSLYAEPFAFIIMNTQ